MINTPEWDERDSQEKQSYDLISKHWWVRFDNYTLESRYRANYAIDLECCITSASVLDWIFQIRRNPWATDEVMSTLLEALFVLLHPQRNLCSGSLGGGEGRKFSSRSELRKEIRRNWRRFLQNAGFAADQIGIDEEDGNDPQVGNPH